MNNLKLLLISLLIPIAISCASAPKEKFSPVELGDNNQSLVYVYCQSGMFGPNIYVGENLIKLSNKNYYYFLLKPGEYRVKAFQLNPNTGGSINPEDDRDKLFIFDPNRTYYIKVISKRVAGHFDYNISEVSNEIAESEISEYSLGKLIYGNTSIVKGYNYTGTEKKAKNKAVIELYRAPNTMSMSSIGDVNIAMYSGNGSNMVGVGLDQCEVHRFYATPGLIKCAIGNQAVSDIGKAAFKAMPQGYYVPTPGNEFTEIETGFNKKVKTWDFNAESGKIYYLEYHPYLGFRFIDRTDSKIECSANHATVIQRRNTDFYDEILSNKSDVGIISIINQESPLLYSSVSATGGALDYLYVQIVADVKNADLKNRLRSERSFLSIEKYYLEKLNKHFIDSKIDSTYHKEPSKRLDWQSYPSISKRFNTKYAIDTIFSWIE